MSPLHWLQYFVYSICFYLFMVHIFALYVLDLFSLQFALSMSSILKYEYDYIIVGSGTAGSLIAHRLATETNYSFLVLEAGSTSQFLMDIPIFGPALHRSIYDWRYSTVPQKNACWAMENRKCRLPQGKVMGGSSQINNMIHVRGNISHYTQWFHGKYTEDYITQQFDFIENNIIHLDNLRYESDLTGAFLKAVKELGFKQLGEKFGIGFSKSKVSQKNGKRWTTSDHLTPFVHVLTYALVEKVIIQNNIAKGVNAFVINKLRYFKANKGVIISAGTFNSPKLLQLSGIGPSNLLKSFGIRVVQDLPVGENLQDHYGTGLDLVLLENSPKITADDVIDPINFIKYYLYGKGPLTNPGAEVLGFVSTTNDTVPDLQFMMLPMGISTDRGSHLRKSLGIRNNIWNEYFIKLFDHHTASIVPIILHPKSRGTVFINSADPKIPPLIDPKYLTHEDDSKLLIKGLKFVTKILNTDSMTKFKASLNTLNFPGCEIFEKFSDEYWQCYIIYMTLSIYHPVGTCSMGLPGNAVVDTNFKVFGVDRLFVADASVLPTLPSGNINAAVAMMANVFFESNLKSKNQIDVCLNNDFLNEVLLQVCLIYVKI